MTKLFPTRTLGSRALLPVVWAAALLGSATLAPPASAAQEDVSSSVQVLAKAVRFNKRSRTYTVKVLLKNTSTSALGGPLFANVTAVRPQNLTVANADGTGEFGPFFTFASAGLQPGQTSEAKQFQFTSPKKKKSPRFNFSVKTTREGAVSGTQFVLPINNADPLVLKATRPTGATLEFVGRRNSSGTPTDVDSVAVRNPQTGDGVVNLDGQRRPRRVDTPNGTRFNLQWLDSGDLLVEGIRNGSQVNAVVDFAGAAANSVRPASVTGPRPAQAGSESLITVRRCDQLESGAEVSLAVRNLADGTTSQYIAERREDLGPGIYSVRLPSASAGTNNDVAGQCNSVFTLLDAACAAAEIIASEDGAVEFCAALASAVAQNSAISDADEAAFQAACEEFIAALREYCALRAELANAGQLQSSLSSTPNRGVQGSYELLPTAQHPRAAGQSVTASAPQAWDGVSTPPSFDVDMGSIGGCGAFRVVLTWDKDNTDVDLHVLDSRGRHAYYSNKQAIPNGFLDVDDTNGFGPEVFALNPLEPGTTYQVYLVYYSDHGQGPTTARVKVYLDDNLVTDFSTTFSSGQQAVVGTYPNAGTSSVRVSSGPQPLNLKPTSNPDVWEYTLPGNPNVPLYWTRKRP